MSKPGSCSGAEQTAKMANIVQIKPTPTISLAYVYTNLCTKTHMYESQIRLNQTRMCAWSSMHTCAKPKLKCTGCRKYHPSTCEHGVQDCSLSSAVPALQEAGLFCLPAEPGRGIRTPSKTCTLLPVHSQAGTSQSQYYTSAAAGLDSLKKSGSGRCCWRIGTQLGSSQKTPPTVAEHRNCSTRLAIQLVKSQTEGEHAC